MDLNALVKGSASASVDWINENAVQHDTTIVSFVLHCRTMTWQWCMEQSCSKILWTRKMQENLR